MSKNGHDPAPDTKYCPSCGRTKPKALFHRNRSRADGVAHECRKCKNAVEAARYHCRKRILTEANPKESV
jgi:hypothetical protein